MTKGGSPTRKGAQSCFNGLAAAACLSQRNTIAREKQSNKARPAPATVSQPLWLFVLGLRVDPESRTSWVSSTRIGAGPSLVESSPGISLVKASRGDGKKTGR